MRFARMFSQKRGNATAIGLMSLLAVSAVSVSSCDNPFFKSKKSSTSSHSGTHHKDDAHSGEFGDDGSGYNPELGDLRNTQGSLKLGPRSTNGKIVVTLPRDRCQAGTIVFGNTRCQAVGRGLTRYSKPNDPRYKQGAHSNGRPCWYLDSRYTNGATPAGNYRLGAVRPTGRDKKHWVQAGIRINDNVPGRGGFVIHSVRGFTENTNAEVQNGYGCVRISQECMTLLHQYRSRGGAGQIVEVNEI